MNSAQLRTLGYTASPGDYYGCVSYSKLSDYEPTVTFDPVTDSVVAVTAPPYESGTAANIGTSSTQAEVLKAYAGRTVETHLAGDFGQGSDGILVGGAGGWIGFSLDNGFVSSIKVGDKIHATNDEAGCS